MGAVKVSNNFWLCDSSDDLDNLWGGGAIAAIRDNDVVAKYYKLIDGLWTFQYDQANGPSLNSLNTKIDTLIPDVSGNNGKVLKVVDGVIVWGPGSSGGYDGDPTVITQDATHRFHTDTQASNWDSKEVGGSASTAESNANSYTYSQISTLSSTVASALDGKADALGSDDNYVTDAEKVKLSNLSGVNSGDQDLSGLVTKNGSIIGASKTKVTYDSKGLVTSGSDATQDDIGDGSTYKQYSGTEKTKLASVASGATANDTDANLKNCDNHTDGTTNKVYTGIEKTKLAGISTGATANSSDATLLARGNHTGTQTASTISDFNAAALSAAPAETATSIKAALSITTLSGSNTGDQDLSGKAPLASPTFTGTVSGVTKSMVGLGSVDNTADTAKPVSTAQQTALDLKANLAGPTFTGTVTLPASTSFTTPNIGAATGTSLVVTGALTSSGGGNGYSTGAGGTVSQGTSRTTTVSLSKLCGTITMFSAAQAAQAIVTFTFTNSFIAAGDFVLIQHISATNAGAWQFSVVAGSGTCNVSIRNVSTASITEATPLRFTIIKGVTS